MLSLHARQDTFRLLLPKDFFAEEILEKYGALLKSKGGFITNPVDFVNETIQSIEILGFDGAAFVDQHQSGRGFPLRDENRVEQNAFMYPSAEVAYRSPNSPIGLLDKTLNIMFRHTLGYVNYFMLFENFWYMYARDTTYKEMCRRLNIDILDERGLAYSRITIDNPIINGMDMLSLNYAEPLNAPQSFKMELKYSNFYFQFIEFSDETKEDMLI